MYNEFGVVTARTIAKDADRLLTELREKGWTRDEAMVFVLNYFKGGKD